MRIALISDTHVGITTEGQLKVMFRELAKESFDVLIHCGDYGGTFEGGRCVKRTVKMMRDYFPNCSIISTIGNHDFWTKAASSKAFLDNMSLIEEVFASSNIDYIDLAGPLKLNDSTWLIGSSGWYQSPNPPTNDKNFLPYGYDGDTNRWLLRRAERLLFDQLDTLRTLWNPDKDKLIFMSHFPVINTGDDYKGEFADFSWSEHIGEILQEEFGCKHFLNGHAHQRHEGPLRYESGSDYYKPKYLILEV
jgi:predicted phosphohydrolase